MKSAVIQRGLGINILFFELFLFVSMSGFAQNTSSITGKILEEKTNQPVPYATIRLSEMSGNNTNLVKGTISDENGNISLSQVDTGSYRLQVSSVGYKTATRSFDINAVQAIDLGTILLQDSTLAISAAVVVADRIQGKSGNSKTIYFVNHKMLNATGSAPELLRQVPGVQVDLKHRIRLDGKADILLLVDGIERDKSYISQLNPSQIDKIEVLDTPPSNYDGNVSGVINIIRKKEKTSGWSGHFFSEIPATADVVYLFPTGGLNYSHGKINLYTSYNGEINYENIDEITDRQITGEPATGIHSVQEVRQKNLSHKFHYGMDNYISPKDVLNFYGFYNQYSYEQDGKVIMETTGEDRWSADKDETDQNRNFLNSLFYKHRFNDEGKALTLEVSQATIRSENQIAYDKETDRQYNNETLRQTTTTAKIDYTGPVTGRLQLSTGLKTSFQNMQDKTSGGFSYREQLYAAYAGMNYKISKHMLKLGMRLEDSETRLDDQQDHSSLSVLPYASFHYQLNEHHDLTLTYRRSVSRPSVYLLNASSYTDDPCTLHLGNPLLHPEFHSRLQLEYASRFNTNFLSVRLFDETTSNAINPMTYLDDNRVFVTQPQNLGDIHQFGAQLQASLKIGILSINPSISLYRQSTCGNRLAKEQGIEDKHKLVFASDISSIVSFKHDWALSAIFQYAIAKENIQDNHYADAIYFISLDKTFKSRLKTGIVCALPLARTVVYQGSDISAPDFTSKYTGNLKLPVLPLMFRLSYQFSTGKNRKALDRNIEKVDTRPKNGF